MNSSSGPFRVGCLLLGVALGGCGGRAQKIGVDTERGEPEPSSDGRSESTDSSQEADPETVDGVLPETLSIPLEPRDFVEVRFPAVSGPGGTPLVVSSDPSLTFAWFPEYPKDITVKIIDERNFVGIEYIGDTFIESIEITEAIQVGGPEEALELSASEDEFYLELKGEGVFTLQLEGEVNYRPPDDGNWAGLTETFWIEFDVRVVEPRGALLVGFGCQERPSFLADGSVWGGGIRPIDAEGEPFLPDNVEPEFPVSVTVSGKPGTGLSLADASGGLGSVIAHGEAQPLDVRTPWGPLVLPLIELGDIDGLEVEYVLQVGRSSQVVEEGGRYETVGLGLWPLPTATYGGVPVCNQPSLDEYQGVSLTPDVCPENGGGFDAELPGHCSVKLLAPGFNGGEGIEDEISFELVDP